jgi:hypothetical protein
MGVYCVIFHLPPGCLLRKCITVQSPISTKKAPPVMKKCYPRIDDPTWSREQLKKLTTIFPEGQVVIKVDGEIVACALSIIISSELFENDHKYLDITANDTFTTHSRDGDVPCMGWTSWFTPTTAGCASAGGCTITGKSFAKT